MVIRSLYISSTEQSLRNIPYGSGSEELITGVRSDGIARLGQTVEWQANLENVEVKLNIESPGLHREIDMEFSRDFSQRTKDRTQREKGSELRLQFCQRDVTFRPWKEGSEKEKPQIEHSGLASEISLRGLRKIAKAASHAALVVDRAQSIRTSPSARYRTIG